MEYLERRTPDECVISSVVAYELFTGVNKSREPEREGNKVRRLISVVRVVAFDETAASQAGRVRAALERIGNGCGPYDLLLAGHALSLGLPLVTNNVRESSRVNGLIVEDWMT